MANKFHTCSLISIFAQVHAPVENGFDFIRRYGGELCDIRSGKEMTLDITLDEKPQEDTASQIPQPDENMPSEGSYDEWFDWFFGNRGR